MPLRYAVTGTDARMERLKELLLADGHTLCPPAEAEEIVPPPWDRQARYTRLESYQTANAALTADGALALLREELDLEGQAVLVTGFGRLGSLCALRLAGAGARVTVAARGELARVRAAAMGFSALDTQELAGRLGSFAALVNTVPALLVSEPLLRELGRDTVLLELASVPGGIDAAGARELGLRYIRAPGLPGKYDPDRAARLIRDALYALQGQKKPRLGLALTGSHCTFARALEAFAPLARDYDLVPILSPAAGETDTRFGPAADFAARLEALCGKKAVRTIVQAEPLGAGAPLDLLLVAPCTGNTLAKLANGVTDTPVAMACKAHLRNGRPLVLAISTNDGLSGSAGNIAALLQRKNVYFVPFGQDAPEGKPFSLQSDLSLLLPALEAAAAGRQLQPLLLGPAGA